jgi:nitrile hydratase
MVLPLRPEGTEGWTEDQLAEIVTRDSMIGVSVPKAGVTGNAVRNYLHAMHPTGG